MTLRLPQAPALYDPREQNLLRSTVEEILGTLYRSTNELASTVAATSPLGRVEFSIGAANAITMRVTPLANTLSFGYTTNASNFNNDRTAQTLHDFAGPTTPYDQAVGTVDPGSGLWIVVWFYEAAGGAGEYSAPIARNFVPQLLANEVVTASLAAGSVTATKISVTTLAAIVAELGHVKITNGAGSDIDFYESSSLLADMTVERSGGGDIWDSGIRWRIYQDVSTHYDAKWFMKGSTVRPTFSIDGDLTVTGAISGTITATAVNPFDITASAVGGERTLRFRDKATETKYNWAIIAQRSGGVDNALEFLPSTAVGGTTFASPLLMLQQNGQVVVGAAAAISGARLTVGAGGTGATGEVMVVDAGSGTNATAQLQLRRNSVLQGLVGVSGGTDGLVTGSVANDLCARSQGGKFFLSLDSGTTAHGSWSPTGLNVKTVNGTVGMGDNGSTNFLQIRPNSGVKGYLQFTENGVADRWVIGIKNGDSKLYFATGSASSNTDKANLDSSGNLTATDFILA